MMAKLLKSVIVVSVMLTFFGGSAMADRHGRDGRHSKKWDHPSYYRHHHQVRSHHHHKRYVRAPRSHRHHRKQVRVVRSYDRHRRHDSDIARRPEYRKPRYKSSKPHPLAPRVLILGGLPVPVPPPPHEVLDYLTGH